MHTIWLSSCLDLAVSAFLSLAMLSNLLSVLGMLLIDTWYQYWLV